MDYKCYNCFYITDRKCNFVSHLNRKIKCIKNEKNNYSDNYIEQLNNKQLFDKTNSLILFDCSTHIFSCKICNKNYNRKNNCERHIQFAHSKIYDENEKNKSETDEDEINLNFLIENLQVINNDNDINILEDKIEELLLFEKKFVINQKESNDDNIILISKILYSQLLEKIIEKKNTDKNLIHIMKLKNIIAKNDINNNNFEVLGF
jgi:hypothetical protein